MKEFSRSMLWIGIFALSSFYPVVGQAGVKNSHHESSSSSESSATAQPISAYGTWTPLNNQPQFPGGIPGVGFPLLLTDGTILVQNINSPHTGEMWKLIPDQFGSYQNGTWEQVASLPAGYAPLYQASAVLADGRVVYVGGEYNGPDYDVVWTSLGAIYDPVADFWTPIAPPPFFNPDTIGDAQSVVFKDGTFMVANALNKQAAILDLNTLTWTETGTSTKLCSNNEESWVLLKNGKVFTVDCHATAMITTDQPGVGPFYSDAASFSVINNLPAAPVTAKAAVVSPNINACTGPLNDLTGKIALWDWTTSCGSAPTVTNIQATHAVGALGSNIRQQGMAGRASQTIYFGLLDPVDSAALRAAVVAHPNMLVTIHPPVYDSELYDPATGTWSSAGAPIERLVDQGSGEIGPSVLRPDGTVFTVGGNGNTGVYDSYSGQWFKGPKLPVGPGLEGQLGCQDAPGALLPNGNVLFVASPIVPTFSPPAHFFEFDGTNLIEQAKLPQAVFNPAYVYNMLVLPTGEVLTTDFTLDVQIYTPGNPNYNKEWAPVITCAPKKVKREHTYTISGIRFNGMSQTSMYGDDYQAASNYPLVRITELASGRVVYCRTHDHSSMAVASDDCVYTYFDVPYYIEPGKYQLEVVANGIPSDPIHITVK